MTVSLDTNALIRFFTKDIPEKAEKVKTLLQKAPHIIVSEVIFPELAYVLEKDYHFTRKEIIQVYKAIVGHANIMVIDQTHYAIDLYERTKLDMADCLIAAHSLKGKLASFDRELLKIPEIKPYWK